MGPFSPRTCRLLVSPINISAIKFDEHCDIQRSNSVDKDTSLISPTSDITDTDKNLEIELDSVPDMEVILAKFGIYKDDTLKTYDSDGTDMNHDSDEQSILQRIRTLVRKSRYVSTYQRGSMK